MRQDLRPTDLYREIEQFCADVRRPGGGQISDGAQMHLSPGKDAIAFTATIAEQADAEPLTRIAIATLATGETATVTDGPNSDRLPRFSPDGRRIAFLSDRHQAGALQLHLLDIASGRVHRVEGIDGLVEHLQWSTDGDRILLRVVEGHESAAEAPPAWMPRVELADQPKERRCCWLYDVATDAVRRLDIPGNTMWETAWCGGGALAVTVSARPGEDGWYQARLCLFDLASGGLRTLHAPEEQLGPPVVSTDGATIAIVEGLCSDRGPVIGDLLLIDIADGRSRTVNLGGVDVVQAEWRSDRLLLLSGYRGLASVIGLYDLAADSFHELWSSKDLSITAACVAGLEAATECVMIVEGFKTAPAIGALRGGQFQTVRSFDLGYEAATDTIAAVDCLTWRSPDGLEIEGFLLRPHGAGPHPVIVTIHGGPVSHWRPSFLIRRLLQVPILMRRGYAIFLPNPRGSSGRGQAFARLVLGDIGGGDALDILAGLDSLEDSGLIDPLRVGVTGVSYGGFMTTWLIGRCDRFAAAVAVSPHTNQVTAHLLSNIPGFMGHLVGDEIGNLGGLYFERSPLFHAAKVRTPTLSIAGALDRCTPPEEAVQFHRALCEAGARSALAVYPQEGHGVRRLPAAIDCTARLVGWFLDHMPDA